MNWAGTVEKMQQEMEVDLESVCLKVALEGVKNLGEGLGSEEVGVGEGLDQQEVERGAVEALGKEGASEMLEETVAEAVRIKSQKLGSREEKTVEGLGNGWGART